MLELGSVVYLKSGSQKIMIISRNVLVKNNDGETVIFEYMACKYPAGFDERQTFYFNEENVDKSVFHGFSDEEEIRIIELFRNWKSETKFPKGKI